MLVGSERDSLISLILAVYESNTIVAMCELVHEGMARLVV